MTLKSKKCADCGQVLLGIDADNEVCPKCGNNHFRNLEDIDEKSELFKISKRDLNNNIEKDNITNNTDEENSISKIFRVIAWVIYIGGFISGFVFGRVPDYLEIRTVFSFSAALLYWVTAFITGTLFLGFSEIISLLHQLVYKKK